MLENSDESFFMDSINQFELNVDFDYKDRTGRKFSFVDLLTAPIGIPELPNFDLKFFDSEDINLLEFSSPKNGLDAILTPIEYENFPMCSIESHKKKKISKPSKNIVNVEKPLEANPNTIIGTITLEERRKKILRYLEKRNHRTWKKRIAYDCRKKVADNRLRIKGRFVKLDEAIAILGVDHQAVQAFLAQEKRLSNGN
ncbi:unnamed protein product [Blepharisma stoltei]|uniref:CCT domain-containing protein n=1 Tax=Blepharisma stoltei TaxID=1481888 RepID=A0AAU9J315_9CILI|nr:unnamed protein product [Blepharisma stoltei]